jgi:HAD superfamily hydrolase (TIGR01549 family)
MPHPIKAVLFDWGETLVLVPNMVNTMEQHIACLEQLYREPRTDGKPALQDYGLPWPRFREAYAEATCTQIRRSHETRREHRFEDRFLNALQLAGVTQVPSDFELAHLVDRFGNYIVREARMIDGATQVIPELAKHTRLGVVSNYPSHRIVSKTLERFGLRQYFSTVVVSGKLGWLKPHPGVYQHALEQIGARAQETVFVGDDLDNDIVGPKALGLRTAWFTERSEASLHADTKISDLRELLLWMDLCAT